MNRDEVVFMWCVGFYDAGCCIQLLRRYNNRATPLAVDSPTSMQVRLKHSY